MLENLLSNDEIERFIQEGRAQVVLWIVRQPVLLERVQSSPLVSGNFQNAQILGPQRFHQLAAMPVHYDAKPLRGPKLSADPRNARESLYKIFPPRGARYRESVKMGGGACCIFKTGFNPSQLHDHREPLFTILRFFDLRSNGAGTSALGTRYQGVILRSDSHAVL